MTDEERFRGVFIHFGRVKAYAARRSSRDADALAAEVMAIAWRRLDRVPHDDPLPWLYATARNLLLAERRQPAAASAVPQVAVHDPEPICLDAELERALRLLPPLEREALLLVAWEDLTPSQAAKALGTSAAAFRIRLFRARRRLHELLGDEPRELTLEKA